jgi:hypothetical protein
MNYVLTEHAKKMLAEREIPIEWLERVRNEPVLCEPDPGDLLLEHRYRPIPDSRGAYCAWWSTPRMDRFAW